MIDDENTQTDETKHGRCHNCYYKVQKEQRSQYDDLPAEVYNALPEAMYEYNPPCMCSYATCWIEYICKDCAAKVEKPQYLELLDDE